LQQVSDQLQIATNIAQGKWWIRKASISQLQQDAAHARMRTKAVTSTNSLAATIVAEMAPEEINPVMSLSSVPSIACTTAGGMSRPHACLCLVSVTLPRVALAVGAGSLSSCHCAAPVTTFDTHSALQRCNSTPGSSFEMAVPPQIREQWGSSQWEVRNELGDQQSRCCSPASPDDSHAVQRVSVGCSRAQSSCGIRTLRSSRLMPHLVCTNSHPCARPHATQPAFE
jgi:hypothetical protein